MHQTVAIYIRPSTMASAELDKKNTYFVICVLCCTQVARENERSAPVCRKTFLLIRPERTSPQRDHMDERLLGV